MNTQSEFSERTLQRRNSSNSTNFTIKKSVLIPISGYDDSNDEGYDISNEIVP